MSFPPADPVRLLWKNSTWPSLDSAGAPSMKGELTGAPRFTGVSQGLSRDARLVTQMSTRPNPPGRSEAKYIVSSSDESVGLLSANGELISDPRFTGADHSELAKELKLGARIGPLGCVSHANNAITATSGVRCCMENVFMGPPVTSDWQQ